MASNEVEAYRRAQRAHADAVKAKADPRDIAQLKAAMKAAATKTPTGDGRGW